VLKELDILGARNALDADFVRVIDFLGGRRFPTSDVITHSVPLPRAGEALDQWSRHPEQFLKIQVDFDTN
jgi:threonine dehydrogenase-like Zn-dependent dehydrogenase